MLDSYFRNTKDIIYILEYYSLTYKIERKTIIRLLRTDFYRSFILNNPYGSGYVESLLQRFQLCLEIYK